MKKTFLLIGFIIFFVLGRTGLLLLVKYCLISAILLSVLLCWFPVSFYNLFVMDVQMISNEIVDEYYLILAIVISISYSVFMLCNFC